MDIPSLKVRQRIYTQVQTALMRGTVKRGDTCEQCGKCAYHAHHDDYSKPLEVRWLCASCHGQLHADLRAEAKRRAA